ncbi:hypothetical protein [Streptomyces bungoensis]|uniref:hypothetical protein n=1 Tax=Streptomyces bungoensis TaxID=285568 RepID=UPI0033E6E57D
MTEPNDQRGNRYDRARGPDEPGAHSGAESQSRKRSVPGTASGPEGYRAEHGTTAGRPLEGVEAGEHPARYPDAEDDGRPAGP